MSHIHNIIDTDKIFTIDPITRAITTDSDNKIAIMQYDHYSERLTFRLPRMIEGHDMMMSNVVQLHYNNVGTGTSISNRLRNPGVSNISDLRVDPEDEEYLVCSWLIPNHATMYAGTLSFLIKFACINGADIVYIWHTNLCTHITVLPGLNNSGEVSAVYPDMLIEVSRRIDEVERKNVAIENEIYERIDEAENMIYGPTEVFARKTVDFTLNEGLYYYQVPTELNFTLIEGNVYLVEWNGKLYTCVAKVPAEADNVVYVGNLDIVNSTASTVATKLDTPIIRLETTSSGDNTGGDTGEEPDAPSNPSTPSTPSEPVTPTEIPFIFTSPTGGPTIFITNKVGPHTIRVSVLEMKTLPEVSAADNGKILEVVNSKWKVLAVKDSSVKTYVDEYISSALGGDY